MSEHVAADILAGHPGRIYVDTQSWFAKGIGPIWSY